MTNKRQRAEKRRIIRAAKSEAEVAVEMGNIVKVRWLVPSLEVYRAVDGHLKHGKSLFDVAKEYYEWDTLKYLATFEFAFKRADRHVADLLLLAIAKDDPEFAQLFVRYRSRLPGDPEGLSPLHRASHERAPKVIRFLVACGDDIDAKTTSQGRTPLMVAVARNWFDGVKLFVELGASVAEVDHEQKDALCLAANTEIANYLREVSKA